MNFDFFTRDENGDKLGKIDTIRLRGAGSQISGIESLAISVEILPRLCELSLIIDGEEDFADQFVLRFFNVLSLMEDIPPNLHTLVFESETPMMAIDQPMKAARMFLFRLVDNRSIRKLSLCINVSEE